MATSRRLALWPHWGVVIWCHIVCRPYAKTVSASVRVWLNY